MKNKKIFGIGAVGILLFVALVPATNGLLIKSEKKNDFGADYNADWDLKLEVDDVEYLGYDTKNDLCTYKIYFSIENIGTEDFDGSLHPVLKINHTTWEVTDFDLGDRTIKPSDPPLEFDRTLSRHPDEDDIGGRDLVLEGGFVDGSGGGDKFLPNNFGFSFGRFWNDDGDEPLLHHLLRSLPYKDWINSYFEFVDPDTGEKVKIPRFRDLFTGAALPSLVASNKLGWWWDFGDKFADLCTASLKYFAKFSEVCADLVLIGAELYALINEVVVFFNPISETGAIPGPNEISVFLATLALLATTLVKFIEDLRDLPLNPEDPERVELENAVEEFKEYILSEPWTKPIKIEGKVHNVGNEKVTETLTITCRNTPNQVTVKSEPQSFGAYEIASWDPDKLEIFFNDCQIFVTGSEHPNQELKTLKLFSHVAPGGKLHCSTFKFSKDPDESSRIREYNLMQRFLERFPNIKHLFSLPIFC